MPTPISHRLVRIRRVPFAPFVTSHLIDVYTEESAEVVRGNATRFEFGFFDSAGAALDLSDVESLNLKIQPSQTVDGVLADQTITELDLTLDAESWEDGSKSHAVFEFTNAEMNIPPEGASRPLWLVVTAITAADGNEVTLCAGYVILHEDNNGSSAVPPAFPGAYLTIDQGDARYGPPGDTAPVNASAAAIIIDPTGSDNSISYTAVVAGADGNDITVAYASAAVAAEMHGPPGSCATATRSWRRCGRPGRPAGQHRRQCRMDRSADSGGKLTKPLPIFHKTFLPLTANPIPGLRKSLVANRLRKTSRLTEYH